MGVNPASSKMALNATTLTTSPMSMEMPRMSTTFEWKNATTVREKTESLFPIAEAILTLPLRGSGILKG